MCFMNCPHEDADGMCRRKTCIYEQDDTDIKDLLYDDYQHGEISMSQARRRYAAYKRNQ